MTVRGKPAGRDAYRVRIPAFLAAEREIGLGDVIKRATSTAGLRPCGGCAQRAAALNGWVTFVRSERGSTGD